MDSATKLAAIVKSYAGNVRDTSQSPLLGPTRTRLPFAAQGLPNLELWSLLLGDPPNYLIQIKAFWSGLALFCSMEWKPITTAPFDRDLEVAVIDTDGEHVLSFPCRHILGGWINAASGKQLYSILPTHWRVWNYGVSQRLTLEP